jgi:hypothetical protein
MAWIWTRTTLGLGPWTWTLRLGLETAVALLNKTLKALPALFSQGQKR